MSRLREIVDSGDWIRLAGVAMNARMEAEAGNYCRCATPALVGVDLMCGECLLENEGQLEKRIAWMNAPHVFEPDDRHPEMCGRCSGWDDDRRHVAARSEAE